MQLLGVMVVGALLLLSSSSLVPQSRFPQSRLLQLRGGSSAVAAPAPSVASQQAQPQGPLRLQLVVGSDTAVVRMPRIELSSANVEALQLQPGARVRIHRADKRAGFKNPFQKPVPDSTLGEVREAVAPTPLQPYALGETEARLPTKAMQAMRLQAGDSVLVSPVGQPAGQPAGQASRAPNAYQSRRRSGGFWWPSRRRIMPVDRSRRPTRKTRTRRRDERCEKRPFVTYLLVLLRVYVCSLFSKLLHV